MLPQTIIYYTAYDQIKMRLGFVDGQQNFIAPIVSGVTSRCKPRFFRLYIIDYI